MSPMGPPNGTLLTGAVFTKKISVMKTFPPVKLVTRLFRKGMFCDCSVTRPGGSTPTPMTWPSLKKTAHSSLSTVSCEYMGTF